MTASNFTRYLKASSAPAILGLALMSAPAFAQDADATDNEVGGIAPAEQVQTAQLETAEVDQDVIVVTGSRLSNPNLETNSPIAVVTEDEVELRQVNTVEEFLRQIPGVAPGIGSNVNNGNGGNTTLNLRGLGAVRNVVLLNGTRVTPFDTTGVTNVDIIPVALLERTDVLTGGASATYGGDAVAGVTNFVTKRDFEGVELSLLESITEEGDGNIFRGDLLIGANFDDGRGNAVLNIGYQNRDQVTQADREFSQVNINSATGAPGGSGTAVPAVILSPFGQLTEDGELGGFDNPFNFNPFNLLQTPLEQFRIYGSAYYEVNENLEFFAEGLFVNSTSATQIAPSGTFFNAIDINASNPFLPTALLDGLCDVNEISDVACAAGAAATDPDSDDFLIFEDVQVGRRFVELGTRDSDFETTFFQLKGGLRGNIFENIDYEIYGAYGESENVQTQAGNGTLSGLQQSILAVSPTECIDPSDGCVPINLFGPLGSITPAVGEFLDVGNTSATGSTLATVSGFVGGDFGLTSPYAEDPISFVVGGEYREYTAFQSADALSQIAGEILGNGAPDVPFDASYDVYEAFGELAIPVLSDVRFAEELTFSLKGRVSDYSTTGTEYTYTAGGTWTPYPGFQIRGNFARSVRAPNLFELFQPQITGLTSLTFDPCEGAGPLTDANLAAVCLAQGAPESTLGSIINDPADQPNLTF
ncbi:MAG: TonB-dependent receptor, partial [Pseudomonadota bacterium]